MHNVAAAKQAMSRADLVIVWGSTLNIIANYFDPWDQNSRWSVPAPVLDAKAQAESEKRKKAKKLQKAFERKVVASAKKLQKKSKSKTEGGAAASNDSDASESLGDSDTDSSSSSSSDSSDEEAGLREPSLPYGKCVLAIVNKGKTMDENLVRVCM